MSAKQYSKLEDSQLNLFHRIAHWFIVAGLLLWFLLRAEWHVTGRENRPKNQEPFIVASNHVSSLDPLVVSCALFYQPISYMAKIELFKHPAAIAFFWITACFAVNREKLEVSTVKSALKVLKAKGWALGLFPEGTRKKDGDGKVQEAKQGVAYFARAANVPVLPVGFTIQGDKRRYISVHIGTLIPPDKDLDAMTRKVQTALAELVQAAENDYQRDHPS